LKGIFCFLGEGDEDDPGWDLAILASCDHLILTYGTFGYMAAWFKGPGNGHLNIIFGHAHFFLQSSR
jgi:hypothetical protein